MAYELITARNLSEGLHVPFVYVNDITHGVFINLLLFMFWCAVTFGIYFSQKKAIGIGDFPMAVGVSGLCVAILTIILRLVPGLVRGVTLVPGLVSGVTFAVVLIVALFSVIWFLLSKD